MPAGFDHQNVIQLGATYDFKFLRVYGQLGRVKTEADTTSSHILYQLGAAVPLGNSADPGRLRPLAHEDVARRRRPTSITSIGYDYFLSKSTDIYVAAMYEKLSFTSNGNSFAGGIRHRF